MDAVNKPAREDPYTPVNSHYCLRKLHPRIAIKLWFLSILFATITNALPYKKKTQNIFNGTSNFENVSQKLDELVFDTNLLVPQYYHLLPKTLHKYYKINGKLENKITLLPIYDPEKYSASSAKAQYAEVPYVLNEKVRKSPINSYVVPPSHRFFMLTRKRRQVDCTLSEEKLLEFKKTINEVLSQASTELKNCESNGTSSNCEKWVMILQCGVRNLKDGLIRTKSSTNSYNEIRRWHEAYKTIKFKYEQGGDSIRQAVSGNKIRQFDSTRDELVDFSRTINNIESDIKERKIKSSIEEIKLGNIENAVKIFNEIGRASALIDIVRGVYGDNGDLNDLKNLVSFANRVRTCSQYEIIYITLYDLIKSKNRLTGSEVIILHNNNSECIKDSPIQKLLVDKVLETVNSWAIGIRNSDYKHIISLMDVDYNSVSKHYPELIRKSYDNNLDNFKNILKFIRDTPYIKDECVLLPLLYNSMRDNNDLDSSEFITVVYRVKVLTSMTNYPQISAGYTNKIEEIKKAFPNSVANLIWRGNDCTIMNKYKEEYIYSPQDSFAYDRDRRQVFTWVPGGTVIQGGWRISPESEGEQFTIMNVLYKEYLYAASDFFGDSKIRRVFTWRPGTSVIQAAWHLKPVDNAQYFAIKNKEFQEYLYSPDDDRLWNSDRRHVYVWKGQSNIRENMKWQIQC